MDPFTLSVSIAGLASLTIELVKLAKRYADGITQSGREEVESLQVQLQALHNPLRELGDILRSDAFHASTFTSDSGLYIAQQYCTKQLEGLHRKLSRESKRTPGDILKSQTRGFFKQLTWPFQSEEVKAICISLQQCVQTFNFALNVENCKMLSQSQNEVLEELQRQEHNIKALSESTSDSRNEILQQTQEIMKLFSLNFRVLSSISSRVNEIQEKSNIAYFRDVLQWVSPGDHRDRHNALKTLRMKGTNQNLLSNDEVKLWISGASGKRQLCCFGNPGAGKSVTCSAMAEQLYSHYERQADILVCNVYFEYQYREVQTIEYVIRSLLRQALEKIRAVPDAVVRAYRNSGKGLGLDDSFQLVEQTFGLFKEIFLSFDALDECNNPDQLLRFLNRFSASPRLLVTGRHHIKEKVCRAYPEPIILDIKADGDDITSFLVHELDEDSKLRPDLMKLELRDEILSKLVDTAHGLFLLPALHIANILSENTIRKRTRALSTFSDCLECAYATTINRIKSQNKADAKQALEIIAWVYFSPQPLSLAELRHALAIEIGSEEFDEDDLPPTSFISSCLGLVVLDPSEDKVNFLHFSLREYCDDIADKMLNIRHDILAHKCLTYITYKGTAVPLQGAWEKIKARLSNVGESIRFLVVNRNYRIVVNHTWEGHQAVLNRTYPFLAYASTQWGHHVRKTLAPSPTLVNLVLRYLLMDDLSLQPSISNFMYRQFIWHHPRSIDRSLAMATPWLSWVAPRLHIVAFLGLCTFWDLVRERLPDLDPGGLDGCGLPPLVYACFGGHTCIHPSFDINSALLQGWEFLMLTDNEEFTQAIMEIPSLNVNTEFPFDGWNTLLSGAIKHKQSKLVALLLKRKDLNFRSKLPNGRYHTYMDDAITGPARQSAVSGTRNFNILSDIVGDPRIDVNERSTIYRGCPPIISIVEEAKITYRGKRGEHTDALELLLSHPKINVNLTYISGLENRGGETALHMAAWLGQTKCMRMLLDDSRANRNILACDGRSPLRVAIDMGNRECVELLLEDENVDLDSAIGDISHPQFEKFPSLTRGEKLQKLREITEQQEEALTAKRAERPDGWQRCRTKDGYNEFTWRRYVNGAPVFPL
ncbi:ankyrin [Xylariaceae sp. FL0662B]|nr:ankyrin [Xylariaceae sp. FL0662B]